MQVQVINQTQTCPMRYGRSSWCLVQSERPFVVSFGLYSIRMCFNDERNVIGLSNFNWLNLYSTEVLILIGHAGSRIEDCWCSAFAHAYTSISFPNSPMEETVQSKTLLTNSSPKGAMLNNLHLREPQQLGVLGTASGRGRPYRRGRGFAYMAI